jgi:hypothetical protein
LGEKIMKKTKAWKWAVIIGVLILAAYQYTQDYKHPTEYEIQDFHLIEQPDGITCGPTSVTMVLKHYGITQTVDAVKEVAKTELFEFKGQKIGATTPEYIDLAMDEFGISSNIVAGSIKKLKYYISQNRPPIVLVRSSKQTWHYVVAIGYTPYEIIIADPGWGQRRVIPLGIFQAAWEFNSDLRGTDLSTTCPICEGDGMWWDNLGPLGKCSTCGGSGTLPDVYKTMVELGEAKGYTMIIPKEPFNENKSNLPNQRQQLPQNETAWSRKESMSREFLWSMCRIPN